jgi:hypothetical protein
MEHNQMNYRWHRPEPRRLVRLGGSLGGARFDGGADLGGSRLEGGIQVENLA